jgi:hypothetical protein
MSLESVDLTQVPNQLGTAVLKASSGAVVRATGDLAAQEASASVLATLYRIVQVRDCGFARLLVVQYLGGLIQYI